MQYFYTTHVILRYLRIPPAFHPILLHHHLFLGPRRGLLWVGGAPAAHTPQEVRSKGCSEHSPRRAGPADQAGLAAEDVLAPRGRLEVSASADLVLCKGEFCLTGTELSLSLERCITYCQGASLMCAAVELSTF